MRVRGISCTCGMPIMPGLHRNSATTRSWVAKYSSYIFFHNHTTCLTILEFGLSIKVRMWLLWNREAEAKM